MEILILGVLLVALMVYVSTKIKKSAAQAFDRETIDAGDFRLVKPEGFISPIDENSECAFEAHSKDYGEDEEHHIWRADVALTVSTDANFESVWGSAKQSMDKIFTENVQDDVARAQKICLLEGEKNESEILFSVFHKIVENNETGKVYDLNISVLQSYREQYNDETSEMLDSFIVK